MPPRLTITMKWEWRNGSGGRRGAFEHLAGKHSHCLSDSPNQPMFTRPKHTTMSLASAVSMPPAATGESAERLGPTLSPPYCRLELGRLLPRGDRPFELQASGN